METNVKTKDPKQRTKILVIAVGAAVIFGLVLFKGCRMDKLEGLQEVSVQMTLIKEAEKVDAFYKRHQTYPTESEIALPSDYTLVPAINGNFIVRYDKVYKDKASGRSFRFVCVYGGSLKVVREAADIQ
jgi:hypothetical protein